MSIAPDIARDFEKQLAEMDPQIRVKEKWVIDKLLRKKRNSRIRKRHHQFTVKCHIDNRNGCGFDGTALLNYFCHNPSQSNLAQCLGIDPFYYEYHAYPEVERHFHLAQVIEHCRLIFSFRCYDQQLTLRTDIRK